MVAAQAHRNPATAAIDAACVMLGSLTRYQIMNDPHTASTTPAAASAEGKNRPASR